MTLAKLLRYATVSVITTCISLTVLGLLVATRAASPGWANVWATAAGTIPSFELNRRWVWRKRERRSLLVEVLPFWILSFTGLALSTIAVSAAASWATRAGLGDAGRTLASELANVAAFGSLWVAQFVILDRVLFGRPPASTVGRVPEAA